MQLDAVTLFEGEYLGQELELGSYRLQKGCEGEITEPIEACEKLFVVSDSKPVAVINDYSDLSVYVNQVASAVQAEAFVCLLTSLETYHLFKRGRIEIDCIIVDRYREPAFAQMSMDDADRLQLHPIEVVQTEAGYQVERCLYDWEAGDIHPQLYEVTEIVRSDGGYSRVAENRITGLDTESNTLPIYE